MFDNTIKSSWDERSRRGMTTLTSFGLQALAVGVLLVLPLLRPAGLPLLRQISTPVSLGRLGEPPVVATHSGTNPMAPSNSAVIILRPSSRFTIDRRPGTDEGPPPVGPSGPYTPGASGPGSPIGVLGSSGTGPTPIMQAMPRPAPPPVRISHMSEGDLIHKVFPTYPPLPRR